MADAPAQEATQEPQGEEVASEVQEPAEPDYKELYEKALAESRKWEKRSKANHEKAKKWDEATGGEESLEARIATLEADKKALEDERVRAALVSKVAKSTGVPESIVAALNGIDEKSLVDQAEAVLSAYKPAGAPSAPEAGAFPHGEAGESLKDKMARTFELAGI